MATDIHGVIARFNDSGTAIITIGATEYNIVHKEPGTLQIEGAMRENLHFVTSGIQQPPVMGDDQLGKIRMTVKVGGFEALSLFTQLTTANTSSNLASEFTFEVKVPAKRGGTTGTKFTTTNASCPTPPKWKEGARFDTLDFELNFRTGAVATY